MNKSTAVILLNYNGFEDTIECVNSLLKHLIGDFKIVIVDNCSKDDSMFKLQDNKLKDAAWEHISLIQTSANNGFSAGNNFGIKYAQKQFDSNFFWLLNNDTVVKNDALSPLIQKYESDEKIGILGSKLLFYDTPEIIQAMGGRFHKYYGKFEQIGFNKEDKKYRVPENQIVDFVIGASLFVSKDFLNKVGSLSEEYFLYYEEVDWSIRSLKYNFYTTFCLDSVVYHKQGKSTGNRVNGEKNLEMMYFQFKNLILFYSKYYPSLIFVPYFVISYRCFKMAIIHNPAYLKLGLQVIFKKRRTTIE